MARQDRSLTGPEELGWTRGKLVKPESACPSHGTPDQEGIETSSTWFDTIQNRVPWPVKKDCRGESIGAKGQVGRPGTRRYAPGGGGDRVPASRTVDAIGL